MKTIIVPIDFSKESLNGLNFSLQLANKTGANIQMVHVVDKNEHTNNEQLEKEHEQAKIKIEDILQKCRAKNSYTCNLDYVIKKGKIYKEIADIAETYDDPLIVLSTHRQAGFEELFTDSIAYKIITHSKSPVISVKKSPISSNIDKIILPLDITFQTREKVPYTAKLAKIFGSEIHLVSVRLSNITSIERKLHQYIEQAASYLEKQNIPYKIKHLHGNNLTNITLDYAHSVNAGLISIMTEQETGFSNLLLGSYAHQMINKAEIPVLLFPNYQLRLVTEDIWDLGAFNPRS